MQGQGLRFTKHGSATGGQCYPFLSCLCSAVVKGVAEQSQLCVSPPLVYRLAQVDDCAAEMGVPEASHMLAVMYCRFLYLR